MVVEGTAVVPDDGLVVKYMIVPFVPIFPLFSLYHNISYIIVMGESTSALVSIV
jgi:hypothetical protein